MTDLNNSVNKDHLSLEVIIFINFLITTGSIILKFINPFVVSYTSALKKADISNFVIFTPIIMLVLSLLIYRSLKPVRDFTGVGPLEPEQLQQLRTAAFNLPLKITLQFLVVILSIVAFVALGWDAFFFKFCPFPDRLVSMWLIWVYTVCCSCAVYIYMKHKMLYILQATSGVAEDKGIRVPIKNRLIITTLMLAVMVFLFTFVYSFARINDALWHDEMEAGKVLLVSLRSKIHGLRNQNELRAYINNLTSKENLFIVNSDGEYLTEKPGLIPDNFDIKSRVLPNIEGRVRISGVSPAAALKVIPLEGRFKGLYIGTLIRLCSHKQDKIKSVSIFFWVMCCFLLCFVVLIIYYVANDTSKAVKEVTSQMVKISDRKKPLYAELKVTSLDEVGDLTRAFNNLQMVLRSYQQELDEANQRLLDLERRRTEDARHDYQLLAENITDVIFTIESDLRLTYVSPSVQHLRGYSAQESRSQGIGKWFTPNSLTVLKKAFKEEMMNKDWPKRFISRTMELEVICQSGHTVWTEARMNPILDSEGRPMSTLFVLRDITERKKMEEEMLKIQKLESLGILAGGIAHDFNNLLTVIIGNLSFMEIAATSGASIFEVLKETKKVSQQTQKLTQQLLTFSKGGEPIRKNISIARLLQDSASLSLCGSRVKCELSIPDDLWWAKIDEGQINQAVSNLIINADQAMPEGGKIEVSAQNTVITDQDGLPLPEGKYIKISVKDQGIGISEEYRDKIFDPYFTTKPKGSGLGLAITYSIIKRHGGHITLESEMAIGSCFHFYLPSSVRGILPAREGSKKKPSSGQGKILFMDDQANIRHMIRYMLTYLGYQVEMAIDGAEAIELYKKAKELGRPFDAVILDLTIPGGLGGKEAITELIKINPQVKAIVSSGYFNDPIMSDYKTYGFSGVISKPYELNELSEILHEVISS